MIESGEGVTHSIPIYEGYSLPHSIFRSDFGGRDITEYLIKLLAKKKHKFYTTADRQIVKNMKEKICYISPNDNHHNENNEKYVYQLPDGNNIELDYERYQAPEIMFQPKLMENKEKQSILGLDELINKSIMTTDIDLRRTMWGNLVLCGGNTMFKGLKNRLNNELLKIIPKSVNNEYIKINASNDRKYSVWIGAAILSNTLRNNWMTKAQFEEFGISRINVFVSY